MIRHAIPPLLCVGLLLAGTLWSTDAQAATSCSARAGDIRFLPALGGQEATAAMDITVTCDTSTGLLSPSGTTYITACLYIGRDEANPRRMGPLRYDLYLDPQYTRRWRGTEGRPAAQEFRFSYPVANRSGTGSRSYRVYARLPAQFADEGTHTQDFFGGHTHFQYKWDDPVLGSEQPSSCTNPLYSGGEGQFPFTVSAVVPPACRIDVTPDLDFGTVAGVLDGPRQGTTDIGIRCSSGRPWSLGLGPGGYATASTRRMAGPGGRTVEYELYRDSARTQRWGDTPDVDTLNGTGTEGAQQARVYGVVPAQPTPPAGTYRDTVTVTLTF